MSGPAAWRRRMRWAVLANPLVYMSEGFRSALAPQFPHMALWAIYAGLLAFIALLTWSGITGFRNGCWPSPGSPR